MRQIGVDIARKGLQDEGILPFLHQRRRPPFFTRNRGFYRREVCHRRYVIVYLEVVPEEVAIFVRRVLRLQDCIRRQNAWEPSCVPPTAGWGYGDSTPKKRG